MAASQPVPEATSMAASSLTIVIHEGSEPRGVKFTSQGDVEHPSKDAPVIYIQIDDGVPIAMVAAEFLALADLVRYDVAHGKGEA